MLREATTTAEYMLLDQRVMESAKNFARQAKEQLGRRVVEVGLGAGTFMRHLVDRELVIDIDMVEECRVAYERESPAAPKSAVSPSRRTRPGILSA